MTSNHKTLNDFTVFRLALETGDSISFQIREPNMVRSSLTSASLVLDGVCNLSVTGAIFQDGKVVPHTRVESTKVLNGFDKMRRSDLVWYTSATAVLSATEPSTYLCIQRLPESQLPLTYSVIDTDNATIPTGALFVPTEDCFAGENTYLKHEPYLNENAAFAMQAQSGKIIIVEKNDPT